MTTPTPEQQSRARDIKHYKYVGGGMYRDSRVPQGETADVIHGEQIMEVIATQLESAQARIVELEKKAALHDAINLAAETLPDDGHIVEINIEKGSAWVVLYDGNGNHDKTINNGTLAEQVIEAINAAMKEVKG